MINFELEYFKCLIFFFLVYDLDFDCILKEIFVLYILVKLGICVLYVLCYIKKMIGKC